MMLGCGAKVAVDASASSDVGGAGGAGGAVSTSTTTSVSSVSSTSTTTSVSSSSSSASSASSSGLFDAGIDASPPPTPAVYAHSGTQLFAIDPDVKDFGIVGSFNGCGSVVDLAVDHAGRIFATTPNALYRIDPTTAACTLVASGGSYPNSLSFVPAGTLDPNEDVLVGYRDALYVRIDQETGEVTVLGELGGGFSSSGDLVAHPDGTAFLSAKGPGCAESDCYLQVNPKTGGLVQKLGNIGAKDVWGMAYWGGTRYAFTKAGAVLVLDATGHGTPLALTGLSAGISFWGAGSSTAAAP
ncbi:Hypothetical protein A7982_11884 [Minicystis rosea]|nr:Hypothetical protein A7982_11884 [Minicystis rosea]